MTLNSQYADAELVIQLRGSGGVNVPDGTAAFDGGGPAPTITGPTDGGTGVLGKGNVSLFPPGFGTTALRSELTRQVSAAQQVADALGGDYRVTHPGEWHRACTSHLMDQYQWAITSDQRHRDTNINQNGTVSQAIVKAVAAAGLPGTASLMLKAVFDAALVEAGNQPLSLFTWKQSDNTLVVANINYFEMHGGQPTFFTAQVHTVCDVLETSFLLLLKYASANLKQESYFSVLTTP